MLKWTAAVFKLCMMLLFACECVPMYKYRSIYRRVLGQSYLLPIFSGCSFMAAGAEQWVQAGLLCPRWGRKEPSRCRAGKAVLAPCCSGALCCAVCRALRAAASPFSRYFLWIWAGQSAELCLGNTMDWQENSAPNIRSLWELERALDRHILHLTLDCSLWGQTQPAVLSGR